MSKQETIKTIDISKFTTGSDEASLALAEEINRACTDIGFLVIEGHGVPASLIERFDQNGRDFFDLPEEQKRRYQEPDDCFYGYKGNKNSVLAYSMDDKDAKPDLREQFGAGQPDWKKLTGGQKEVSKEAFHHLKWPEEINDFAETWCEYYSELTKLGEKIMRVFAVALGLPVDYFDEMCREHCSSLAVFNYPEQTDVPEEGQLRGGAHTDFGSLTIVNADWDAEGGLEVYTKDGDWMRVPAKPGMFAVNIGDMMAQWTNDRWVSTLHRVANPKNASGGSTRRQSTVMFHTPNYDTLVECFPSCVDSEHPAKYPPITVGDHHMIKMGKMYDVEES